jgi:trehalose 6-phosphate phosphatase
LLIESPPNAKAANEEPELITAQIAVEKASLFLDLDGTLAEFAPLPSDVVPVDRRTRMLKRARDALNGRLAIVSGRALKDVDRIVESAVACVAGSHGLERRNAAGETANAPPHPRLPEAIACADSFVAQRPGLIVERKSASFALHFRAAAQLERTTHDFAEQLAADTGLSLVKGVKVVELKTPGANKGDALRAFIRESPFIGSTPIFIGDDITDEDAFQAVAQLGGLGVLVGQARDTHAAARLDDPDAVLAWLERSIETGVFEIERQS